MKVGVCMKKKLITFLCILLISIILLFPMPVYYKDGGSVRYAAILYSVTDVHSISLDSETGYEEGFIVEILGFEIFNNVK